MPRVTIAFERNG